MINAAFIVAIGAALFAAWAAWAASRTLRHDQVQTGTRQPLVARRGYRDLPYRLYEGKGDPQPEGWEPHHTRWTPIRLINRAGYAITVEGPTVARLGWKFFGSRIEVEPSRPDRTVAPNSPVWYFVRLRRTQGWSARQWRYLRVRWVADEGIVRFHGWVRLRPGEPPTPTTPEPVAG
jgi:hypothetical protein